MKICIYSYRAFDEAEAIGKYSEMFNIEVITTSKPPCMETLYLAESCDYISVITTPISSELIDGFKALGVKMISTRTVGYDHIDIDYAKTCNIAVSNATYASEGVADYAIMLMLMTVRKMKRLIERSNIQDFSLDGLQGKDFSEMTIGIIGTGNIGKTVIKHLTGFGNRILAYGPVENQEISHLVEYVSLDTLLEESDIISLHALISDQTYHMIDYEAIDKMKDNVILINTARGGLINTQALLDNLDKGKFFGVGLDVFENEEGLVYKDFKSEVINHRDLALLRTYPNVVITPHMAFYTERSVDDMVKHSLESCLAHENKKDNQWRIV